MQLELALQPHRGPVLRIASSPEAAWQGGIAAWFSEVTGSAWSSELPAVVVVPTRPLAQALRARLLTAEQSAFGVHFVTPPYLRELLQRHGEGKQLAAREHLRLLLAVSAEEHLAGRSLPEPEQLAATSVRRTPDHLLRLIDQLEAAGWSLDAIDLQAFRPIIKRFRAELAECDFETVAEIDRALLARAKAQSPQLGPLLISGFHGAHWQLWPLLQAAVASSQDATVILQYPREETADLDSVWIGSWEEAFGEATSADAAADDEGGRECRFLVGMDTQEQAAAITATTLQFLADERCSRLAIICPAPGALPRLVASALTLRGIPHYDAIGQLRPGIFESAAFNSWMELQRTPRLNALLRFLDALEIDHVLFANVSRELINKILRNALSDIAIDELGVLAAHCADRGPDGAAVRDVLATIHFLPERSTFIEFLRTTAAAFATLQWDERWQGIDERSAWAQSLRPTFSRTLYLRWLSDIASTLRVARDAVGSHPFSRVQIITPAQAEDQSWSHLILAGLNEGAWPGRAPGDFLPAEQIDAFNRSVQKLNRAATRQGKQGEGHVAVCAGHTLFLGAQQQRQLALAQFSSLIDSASVGLALSASLIQEAAPERISNPSEFFSRVYLQERGAPVSQTTMRALRETTACWLQEPTLLAVPEAVTNPNIAQTAVAYRARRALEKSDEYDFALRTPPHEIKALSVSDVEAMLKSPAQVWMKRFLGVEGAEDVTYAWNSTVGKWTHDWLASISAQADGFFALPTASEIERAISRSAERKRTHVLQLCQTAGKVAPDWWQSAWEGALCLARALGEILATADGWNWASAEWNLKSQSIAVRDGRALLIRGRADLLFARTDAQPNSLALPELWIVDFKTGNKKLPAAKKSDTPEQRQKRVLKLVLKRDALQLGLYAMAARALGAGKVDVSLISPVVRRAEPRLSLDDFAECEPAFAELARMQQEGVFGMRGPLRGKFSFIASYPIATLAIAPEIVDDRWELTHEALALEEEPFW